MKRSLSSNSKTSSALLNDKVEESPAAETLHEIQGLWAVEAIRRRDEVRSGQVKSIPGEQVLDEVRRLIARYER
jgi:hypothetical protein